MKRLFLPFIAITMALTLSPQSANAAITPVSQIQAGDLVRGETFSAVYYMGRDGFRYVFPNSKTYDTWYDNFDTVKWLTDTDLATIQIGGNVTYRPGVRMIKINSDPKTYAVDENGSLRWVNSEQVAVALYGADWNKKIDDVPDAFFGNYTKGPHVEVMDDFNAAMATETATNINEDKGLQAPIVLRISDNQFDQTSVTIKAGRAVKFINNGASKHTATADNLAWGTGTLTNGQHFTRYFKEAGSFGYFCSYHPNSMKATIVVE